MGEARLAPTKGGLECAGGGSVDGRDMEIASTGSCPNIAYMRSVYIWADTGTRPSIARMAPVGIVGVYRHSR
jgi:hypothetical protein